MGIVFVCGADFRAPSEKHVLWLGNELVRQGHRVLVTLPGDPATAGQEGVHRDLQLHRHAFHGRRPRREDVAAVRAFDPTVVHAFSARAPVMAAALTYSRATDSPLFVHWEDDEWALVNGPPTESRLRRVSRAARRATTRIYPPMWHFSTRQSLRLARRHAVAFDALTPDLSAHVRARTGRECVHLLPPGPPPAQPDAEALELPPQPESGWVVAYTGQVHPANVADLTIGMRAVAMLQERGLSVTLVQAGGTKTGLALIALAEKAGMRSGSLVWLGYVGPGTLNALLARADVLIQPGAPSEFNRLRLPSKLQAYLSSGTPTITFSVGIGHLLRDREEVLMTRTGEPGELADRIAELTEDAELRQRLATGGPAAAARLFDTPANVRALVAHYSRWAPMRR